MPNREIAFAYAGMACAAHAAVEVLQVKTIAATKGSASYAQTRGFYARLGFMPLEVFPELWAPHNPCLQFVKFPGGRQPA